MKPSRVWDSDFKLIYNYDKYKNPLKVYYMDKEELNQYLSKYKESNKHQLKY